MSAGTFSFDSVSLSFSERLRVYLGDLWLCLTTFPPEKTLVFRANEEPEKRAGSPKAKKPKAPKIRAAKPKKAA